MVRTIEYRWNQRVNSHVGPVRLPTTDAVVVPAGQNLVLEGVVRISQKLRDMSEVFASFDLDVGRTYKVKHSIKLQDEAPFKHRARPIHPDEFEAVRWHSENLLEAGII